MSLARWNECSANHLEFFCGAVDCSVPPPAQVAKFAEKTRFASGKVISNRAAKAPMVSSKMTKKGAAFPWFSHAEMSLFMWQCGFAALTRAFGIARTCVSRSTIASGPRPDR